MALRNIDDILKDLGPQKSKESYNKAWRDFKQITDFKDKPTEDNFMGYFDFLRREKSYQASSMWSIYSKLNNTYSLLYGRKFQQDFPRLTLQLKNYNAGYVRKMSSIFSRNQVLDFLQMSPDGPKSFWLLRKCVAAIAFSGGLRCAEVKNIKFEDLDLQEEGYYVEYVPAKQRQEVRKSRFLVPRNKLQPEQCFARHIENYLNLALDCYGTENLHGDLFRTCLKGGGLSTLSMGINFIYKIPRCVAEALQLPNPERFTGHAFRRSAATNAADSGANSVELRRHFGWKDDQTANKYLQESKPQLAKMAKLITDNESPNILEDCKLKEMKCKKGATITINVQAGATLNVTNLS